MKKEQREAYRFLANFPREGYGLCNCCKFAEWNDIGGSCCEADLECHHPLGIINGEIDDGEHMSDVWGYGADCWGFRPNKTLQEIGVIASIRNDGNFPHFSKKLKEWVAIVPSDKMREKFDETFMDW